MKQNNIDKDGKYYKKIRHRQRENGMEEYRKVDKDRQ